MFSICVFLFKTLGAFLLFEVMFLGLASVNFPDVTAGIFAALAILGFSRKNTLLLALAGGISVLIRAAYLYPLLVLVTFFLVESLYKKNREGYIVVLFFICIAPQYWLTWKHTGMFSFLDPPSVKYWRDFHFASNSAGYDTLIPAAGHPWESGVSVGLRTAYQQHQWGDVANLLGARMQFYFSSFVPWGKVYLSFPNERIFGPFVFVLHLATFIFSSLYLRARAWKIGLPLSLGERQI